VSFATDADAKIEITVNAKNTQVRQAGIPGTQQQGVSGDLVTATLALAFGFIMFGISFAQWWRMARVSRQQEIIASLREFSNRMPTKVETDAANSELRPSLQIDYEGTEANRVEVNLKTDTTEVSEIYIRARVRNIGQATAKGVLVFLTSLQEVQASGSTTPTPVHSSMALAWEGWRFQPRDIPQGVTFYVDLMKVSKHTAGWFFSVEKPLSASQTALKDYSGTYRFQLTVTADNAGPATCEVDITYKQDWHTLRLCRCERFRTARPKRRFCVVILLSRFSVWAGSHG
jgi:hypothetical protein